MKINLKWVRKPATADTKQKKVKDPLLQTYLTSLLSLVLCVGMFLGTSFAWFTSEVSNTENEIYIGTLDVGFYLEETEIGTDAEGNQTNNVVLKDLKTTEQNKEVKFFDANVRWEPGYTMLETVHIVNEGDLAFNYVLNFTDGKLTRTNPPQDENTNAGAGEGTSAGEGTVAELTLEEIAAAQAAEAAAMANIAKFFDVWVYKHTSESGPAPASYADIIEEKGWVNAGTLDKLLAGDFVLKGAIDAVRADAAALAASPAPDFTPNAGTTDGIATDHTYTIALHMKEDATSEVAGHKIGLNVKLVAYQMAAEEEKDALGSKYDQMVVTEAELTEAIAKGGMVALAADIELTNGLTIEADKATVLDLNGHKLQMTTSENVSMITNKGTLTVVDSSANPGEPGAIGLTYENAAAGSGAVNTISNSGTMIVEGGVITNTAVAGEGQTINQIGYAIDNYNGAVLTVNGGTIIASGSNYYDGIRLFCGSNETVVTVNGGDISTIWAQNPSDNKAAEVKGTIIINGGTIRETFYENYTTVKVADKVAFENVKVTSYGNGSDKTTSEVKDGYTVYTFVQPENGQ